MDDSELPSVSFRPEEDMGSFHLDRPQLGASVGGRFQSVTWGKVHRVSGTGCGAEGNHLLIVAVLLVVSSYLFYFVTLPVLPR